MENEIKTRDTYEIPAENLSDVVDHFAKFARKAAKLGVEAPSFVEVSRRLLADKSVTGADMLVVVVVVLVVAIGGAVVDCAKLNGATSVKVTASIAVAISDFMVNLLFFDLIRKSLI